MNKNTYEKYALLDNQIKLLLAEKDELKAEILQELVSTTDKTAETAVGKFTITQLKTWTYTPKVEALDEAFKAQKATEQSTGDATFTEKPSLRFTQIKL